jgi:cation diffusion facilitator family transporter
VPSSGVADMHHHHGGHAHSHDRVDPSIATSVEGVRAVAWSFAILIATALVQWAVVLASGSVALLADTIHNIGDAGTAIPLWVAFMLGRRPPSRRFTYGYGRVEDLAGLIVLLVIFASAVIAAIEAVDRFLHPQAVIGLPWVALAGIVGFLGNEAVAVLRIRVGRRINSVALVADGNHARADGLTSLAVVVGAVGVWLGMPLADPVVGLAISAAIVAIAVRSGGAVFTRLLDGVEPGVIDEVRHAAAHVAGIEAVPEARARWLGHRLHVDVAISVDRSLSVSGARAIAKDLESELLGHLPAVSSGQSGGFLNTDRQPGEAMPPATAAE